MNCFIYYFIYINTWAVLSGVGASLGLILCLLLRLFAHAFVHWCDDEVVPSSPTSDKGLQQSHHHIIILGCALVVAAAFPDIQCRRLC